LPPYRGVTFRQFGLASASSFQDALLNGCLGGCLNKKAARHAVGMHSERLFVFGRWWLVPPRNAVAGRHRGGFDPRTVHHLPPRLAGRGNRGLLTTMSIYSRSARPVNCKVCGKQLPRRRVGRTRNYCSDKCRDAARRSRDAVSFVAACYPNEENPRNSENSSFSSKPCKGENRGRAPLNVLGGQPWPNAMRIEPGLWRRIVLTEIGGG
jgi:hypothetical protein